MNAAETHIEDRNVSVMTRSTDINSTAEVRGHWVLHFKTYYKGQCWSIWPTFLLSSVLECNAGCDLTSSSAGGARTQQSKGLVMEDPVSLGLK